MDKEQEAQDQAQDQTSEDLEAKMAKIANAAQSSHSTRIAKNFDKKLAEVQAAFSSQLDEIKTVLTNPTSEQPEPSEIEKIKSAYEARLKELEGKFAAQQQATEEERAKALRTEERSRLTEALRSQGVDENRLRGAVALLYTEDKRIGRDEAGAVVFKLQKDGYEEELPIGDGIAEWLKSDEGKHYLPARPVAGSGSVPGRPPGNAQKRTKMDAARDLHAAVMAQMGLPPSK